MPRPTDDDVRLQLDIIVKARDKEGMVPRSLDYAHGYASQGLAMSGSDLRVQVLYVLNNITHWRGEQAKEVRATLKAFIK